MPSYDLRFVISQYFTKAFLYYIGEVYYIAIKYVSLYRALMVQVRLVQIVYFHKRMPGPFDIQDIKQLNPYSWYQNKTQTLVNHVKRVAQISLTLDTNSAHLRSNYLHACTEINIIWYVVVIKYIYIYININIHMVRALLCCFCSLVMFNVPFQVITLTTVSLPVIWLWNVRISRLHESTRCPRLPQKDKGQPTWVYILKSMPHIPLMHTKLVIPWFIFFFGITFPGFSSSWPIQTTVVDIHFPMSHCKDMKPNWARFNIGVTYMIIE